MDRRFVQRLGRGRGCHNFVPVLGGGGTEIASPGNFFYHLPGEMSWRQGKLADHVGDHHVVVLSSEGVVLVTSPETESSYPRPYQSLKHSESEVQPTEKTI